MSIATFTYTSLEDCLKVLTNSIHNNTHHKWIDISLSPDRKGYLDDYLKRLGSRTVILESEYVDRNFMDDYCGYYGRCFEDYPKKCLRLHFFSLQFDERFLYDAVTDPSYSSNIEAIKDNYLGYIVIRPVPGANLGKVCLKITDQEGDAQYPILKYYTSHLLGLDLRVESVAFQEQDNVISACATCALWSAFHGIRGRLLEDVNSPFRITTNARQVFIESSTPNVMDKGLFSAQMAAAIAEEDLNPLLSGVPSKSYLKALVRAYLNVGLPVIWGMTLAYEDEESHPHDYRIGEHAVTVMGYNLPKYLPQPFKHNSFTINEGQNPLYMEASRINVFYVHDDQVGPFCRMNDRNEYWERFETQWHKYSNHNDLIDANVNTVIIPCFKKIRLRFPVILNFISRCNIVFSPFWTINDLRLVWDARLYDIAQYKNDIATGKLYSHLSRDVKWKILCKHCPKYVWVVEAAAYDEKELGDRLMVVSFLLDASDMESGDYLLYAIHHSEGAYMACQAACKKLNKKVLEDIISSNRINQTILKRLFYSYQEGTTDKMLVSKIPK